MSQSPHSSKWTKVISGILFFIAVNYTNSLGDDWSWETELGLCRIGVILCQATDNPLCSPETKEPRTPTLFPGSQCLDHLPGIL